MFHSKKIATIIAASAFSLAGCSPTPSSVSSVVKDFFMNISNENFEKAIEYVELKPKEEEERTIFMPLYELFNEPICGGLKDVEVLSEKDRGKYIVVTVEFVCNSGKKDMADVGLAKSEGAWRIIFTFLRR